MNYEVEPDVINPCVLVKLNGKDKPAFKCECGANVFSKLKPRDEGFERYRCNGCGVEYEAE